MTNSELVEMVFGQFNVSKAITHANDGSVRFEAFIRGTWRRVWVADRVTVAGLGVISGGVSSALFSIARDESYGLNR